MFFSRLRILLTLACILQSFVLANALRDNGLNLKGYDHHRHRHGRRADAQVNLAIPTQTHLHGLLPTALSFPQDFSYSSTERTPEAISNSFEPFLFQPNTKPFGDEPLLTSQSSVCGSVPLVMGYYPDWVGDDFPPEKIDFRRYDWIDFAFAVPTSNFSLAWDDEGAPKILQRLVELAHAQGAKVKLSVGGWTGSRYFSEAVSSDQNRIIFVQNILATYNAFGIDGIDIDWEYPGRDGASGNHFRASDSNNFLLFLQLLRTSLPESARISAAVETTTFVGPDGKSMPDLSQFATVLDWVLIMNYDLWGSSSNPGPNAPLHDACKNSTQPEGNAVAAYNAWTSANFPACQLVLGLPSYGYISKSKVERLRTRSKSKKPKKNGFKIVSGDGGDDSQVQFSELVQQGALVIQDPAVDGNTTEPRRFVATKGFERYWDDCSDTPFLRSAESGQVITYDDPYSLAMKAAFAKEVGMLGVNMFDIHGDTDSWDLIDSVRRSLDLE